MSDIKKEEAKEIAKTICQANREGICIYDDDPCNYECEDYDKAVVLLNSDITKSRLTEKRVGKTILNMLEGKLNKNTSNMVFKGENVSYIETKHIYEIINFIKGRYIKND